MKKNKHNKILLLVSFIFLFLFYVAKVNNINADIGFGVSPGTLEFSNMLPGTERNLTLYISRSGENLPRAEVLFDDINEELKSWITFNRGSKPIIEQGATTIEVPITVKIPNSVEQKQYSSNLKVLLKPEEEQNNAVELIPAVQLSIIIDSTNEKISELQVISSFIPDFLIEDGKLVLTIKVKNNGNINDKPDNCIIKLYDINKNFIVERNLLITETVSPYETKDLTLEIDDLNLKINETYFAEIEIYKDQNIIYSDLLSFNVKETESVSLIEDKVKINNNQEDTLIIVGIFFLAFIISVLINRKKIRNIYPRN